MTHHRVRALCVSTSAAASLALLVAGPASAAGGGYGGSSGTVIILSGFSDVAEAKTVKASGGTFSTQTAGGTLKVVLPRGASAAPVQIAVTAGALATVKKNLPKAYSGDTVVSAYGVEFKHGASATTLHKQVTITFTSPLVTRHEKVFLYSTKTGKFEPLSTPQANGRYTIHVKSGETIAVLKH